MEILLVHNAYQQPGGEDAVFLAEKSILEDAGHKVVVYARHNAEITAYSSAQELALGLRTVWARDSVRAIERIVRLEQPQVAHFINTFPLISPAAYYTCRQAGVAVVQSLQNYRLLCPSATFFREGRVCEDCLGKTPPWPGVRHECYRNSRTQTAVVASMLTIHRALGTWREQVDLYVAVTAFAREKFLQGGLPAEKIVVRPNFVHPDPGTRRDSGEYALFVGRLSPEKGSHTLLQAWQSLGHIPLKIAGDGPLLSEISVMVANSNLHQVEILGYCSKQEILALIKGAAFLIIPSAWYEGFPMTLIEAFACGVPVIASKLGALAEIVEDKRTGLHFAYYSAEDLAEKAEWAYSHPKEMAQMGHNARAEFEVKYTAERNYQLLMEIYDKAQASITQVFPRK